MSLDQWILEIKDLCRPERMVVCDGTDAEFDRLAEELVEAGTFVRLKREGSYWCRTDKEDVARVEECTFICSEREEDAGPTNHWKEPKECKRELEEKFRGCMEGRTMYVIYYCMGPVGSKYVRFGVEITDSKYVVLNMKKMTRMGKEVMEKAKGTQVVRGVHSVGAPLKRGEKDSFWPCNPKKRIIAHFPQEREIWSFGSGYGGNALLGKKCFALRLASWMGKEEGWLAEHMLIMGITNPKGEKKYFVAAFPSACGKTNLAMMNPTIEGWKIECVGDDIAWLHFGEDGRLYAINPEAGFFGVAPGTSVKTNPNAMKTIEKNTIFTNVALTDEKDVWWEGIGEERPKHLVSWEGEELNLESQKTAAHPNARFTVCAKQCPIYDPEAENPNGVPISAILFGGRRDDVVPLVVESFSWNHGVFMGAAISSQMTAAAKGEVGKLRHDPFAMLPFCGYHMGDYFAHWIEMGKRSKRLPKIYSVNWFRKDSNGKYLWPGFGENSHVLRWIFERCDEKIEGIETAIGNVPKNLEMASEELFKIDPKLWKKEIEEIEDYFQLFGDKFPKELKDELEKLKKRLLSFLSEK